MSEVRDAIEDKCSAHHTANDHRESDILEFTSATSSNDTLFNIFIHWRIRTIVLITALRVLIDKLF